MTRYRCRVGHAYSVESMMDAQAERLEDALWSALKTLEESVNLSRRLAQRAKKQGQHHLVKMFEERIGDMLQRAELIRSALVKDKLLPTTAMTMAQD